MQYTQDYDETYPLGTRGDQVEWTTIIQPYIKNGTKGGDAPGSAEGYNYNGGIFHCPSFPAAKPGNQATSTTNKVALPPTVPAAAQAQIQNSTDQGKACGATFMARVKERAPNRVPKCTCHLTNTTGKG